jgi:hypothetical protein
VAVLALVLALLAGPARADDAEEPATEAPGPSAEGTIAWFLGDGLDLVGDMRVHLPLTVGSSPERLVYFDLDARTNVDQAEADFEFLVRDVDYTVELGYRDGRLLGGGRIETVASIGQWGTQVVDANGQPWVRYVALGVEGAGFRRLDAGTRWRVQLGPVVDEREVVADGIFRGELRWLFPVFGRFQFGFDAEVDALVDGSDTHADWRIGPRVSNQFRSGHRFSLFAHYYESDNPLGLGESGVLVGVDFARPEIPRDGPSPPDIEGGVGTGGGDDRIAGNFRLHLRSPSFGEDMVGVFAIEANILTADDTGDIYWWYYGGIERRRQRGPVYGAYFYHRSNHQLAEPNDRITFVNVVEVGAETRDWGKTGAHDGALWGVLDVRLRVGYLTNGTFGEDVRWHARPGLRLSPWGSRGGRPFLLFEAEYGDLNRRQVGLGLAFERAEIRVEYRQDDQYFSRDDDAVLGLVEVGF